MEEYHKINAPFKRDPRGQILKGQWCLPELEYLADNQWLWTEKVDGTNIRINLQLEQDAVDVNFGGRTDKAVIPPSLRESLEHTFAPEGYYVNPSHMPEPLYSIGSWMLDNSLFDVTIYGEGYGPKIQKGGGNYRSDPGFVVFDIKVESWMLKRADVEDICSKLGLDVVPLVGVGSLHEAIKVVENGLYSKWPGTQGQFFAEGIVATPTVPLFDRGGRRIITKIKTVDFKEQ